MLAASFAMHKGLPTPVAGHRRQSTAVRAERANLPLPLEGKAARANASQRGVELEDARSFLQPLAFSLQPSVFSLQPSVFSLQSHFTHFALRRSRNALSPSWPSGLTRKVASRRAVLSASPGSRAGLTSRMSCFAAR